MMRRHHLFFLICAVLVIGFLGFHFGHKQYVQDKIINMPVTNFETALYGGEREKAASENALIKDKADIPPDEEITPSTKIVYEYYYTEDSANEIIEEEPPYFLIGETKEELINAFPEWEIVSFSASEVVMRKMIEGRSPKYYIVGEYEGYVAVFYEKEINGDNLKEITDMPMNALPEEEQQRLRKGIHVSGDSELNKILEDYGS